jgi:hypothetical protein
MPADLVSSEGFSLLPRWCLLITSLHGKGGKNMNVEQEYRGKRIN